MSDYQELLDLIEKHIKVFQSLIETQQIKLDAARKENVRKLEECMRKEQADSLALRGFDQKRIQLAKKLSLDSIPLSELSNHVPDEYKQPFRSVHQRMAQTYKNYQKASDAAKELIEVKHYQVSSIIEQLQQNSVESSSDSYQPDGSKEEKKVTFTNMTI